MFSVIEKMMTSQSKKRFESCYETSIDCMIYSVLLFQTKTLNSYWLCEKVFASDWESQLVYSHERLEARKADDIVIQMKELLSFDRQQLKKTKLIIEVQINKHRWNVTYELDNWVWLSFRNVKTPRLCKDLKDKQLDLYQITAKIDIFYHLCLSVSMKHLHLIFSSKLLRSYSEDLLSEQHSESLRSITIKDDEHWKIDDILNFRRYRGWIQYKVKWKDLDRNDEWYYVDKEKFDDSEKVLNEFHKLYSSKPR